MRRWVGRVTGILGLMTSGSVWADCTAENDNPQPLYSIHVPAKLVMQTAPVGGVLASFESKAAKYTTASCNYRSSIKTTLDSRGREPSGIPNVYKTNIEGVGIRITGWANNQLHFTPPSEKTTGPVVPGNVVFPSHIKVEYIRTGIALGSSGQVTTDFRVEHIIPGILPNPVSFEPTAKSTELINEVYFSSCESQTPNLDVSMGKQQITQISANAAPKKTFTFEVRCRGSKPSTPIPVKVHFEGDSPAEGQLNLSGAGQPSVAKGVQIALTTPEGAKLPFNKAKAVDLK